TNLGFFGDDTLAQRGQCHRELDGGTRLRAARKRQLLVHHGQDTSAGGFNRHHRAVHVAKRVDRRLADDGVFSGGEVACGYVTRKRAGVEPLIVVAPECARSIRRSGAAACQPPHLPAGSGALGDLLAFRLVGGQVRVDIRRGGNGAQPKQANEKNGEFQTRKRFSLHHFLAPSPGVHPYFHSTKSANSRQKSPISTTSRYYGT